MKKIIDYLNKRSRSFFTISGTAFIILISLIDLLTKDFFVLEFYMIPIGLVAWFAGRDAGFFIAFVGGIMTLVLDTIETPYASSPLVHGWNFFMNFGFFLLVVYFLTLLKESMEIKSKFTSTVSHELRTPIAVIQESINIVRDGLLGVVNDQQKDILSTASKNAHRLSWLINDILDFQKLEHGKMKLVLEESDINKIIQEAYEGVELLLKGKDIKFVFNTGKELPKIKFDRYRIIQVMVNLISNAVKFTDKGTIAVSTTKNEKNIQVAVQDTGCGIKPEDMPRLFRSFEQLEGSDKHEEKGTGLGLVISKEIISNHGGKIWAESQYGKGSVFYFTLPV